MPEERIYQSRVGVGGPQRAVLSDARDFGAGIGAAIEQAGSVAHQLQIRDYRLDRQEKADSEAAGFSSGFAKSQVVDDEAIRELEESSVDGKGHAAAVAKLLGERKAALLQDITEDAVRRQSQAAFEGYESRVVARAQAYEAAKRTNWNIDQGKETVSALSNLVDRSGGDDEVYGDAVTQISLFYDNMDGDAALREMAKREAIDELTMAKGSSFARAKPAEMLLELAAGRWDGVLGRKQIDVLQREAQLEIKARAYEADQKAQQARVAAKNALEVVEAEYERGNHLPMPQVQKVLAQARAAGVPEADLIRFGTKIEDQSVLRAFNAANDPDGARSTAEVARIDERIRAGVATPEEYRLRDKLADFADARANDAGGRLAEMAGKGLAGQEAALAEIDKLPAATRFTAAAKMGYEMGYVALAKPQTRRAILSGLADVKANKELVDATLFEEEFRKTLGTAASGMSEAAIEGRMQAALGYYAHYAKAKGAKGDDIDPTIMASAFKVAFGGERRNGVWQGGIGRVRGRQIRLPDGYTAEMFDQRMSRITFADAVYRDGSPVRKADVLNAYTPVFVGNTAAGHAMYHFIDAAGNELKLKDGRAFPMVMD